MKAAGAANLIFSNKGHDIDLIQNLVYHTNRVIGRNEFIKRGRKQHCLLLIVSFKNNFQILALFHAYEDNKNNSNDSFRKKLFYKKRGCLLRHPLFTFCLLYSINTSAIVRLCLA